MELVVCLVIIGLFAWFRNSVTDELRKLSNEVESLRDSLQRAEKQKKEEFSPGSPSKEHFQPKAVAPEQEKIIIPQEKERVIEDRKEYPETIPDKKIFAEAVPGEKFVFEQKTVPAEPPRPSFFERYPDLEKFIGENLINKIGIAILVLGIGYFVKYAIDKNWINEIGRVGIGVLAGGVLIFTAHRMRKSFQAFSSVLVGGGLAVLYFTIAIGFHQYQIFSQGTAFVLMILITGFAVALSLVYNRIELAVLSLIGGFSSPFILSTGEGNYKILFTYLLILNCGMLVLAFLKKWNLVNILCYLFTIVIYGSWLVTKCLDVPDAPYAGALLFGSAFFLIFFLMNIIYNIKNKVAFKAFEVGMLLSNTALFYAAGMGILFYYFQARYQGIFTAGMGVFSFAFAFAFYKNKNIDRNLIFLLIGLVLTFISLTAPIQLEGNHITLFWAAEGVLLLWFSQKSGIKLIRVTSVVVNILMLISLLMDWVNLYNTDAHPLLPVFLNKAFITSLVSLASVFLSRRLLGNETEYYFLAGKFKLFSYVRILRIIFTSILFFMFLQEINYQLVHFGVDEQARNISIGIYNFAFLGAAFMMLKKELTYNLTIAFVIISGLCLFAFITIYNPAIIHVRNGFLQEATGGFFFLLHFLLVILFGCITYVFNYTLNSIVNKKDNDWIKWVTVFLVVYLFSAELNHIVSWISYSQGRIISEINRQVFKAGYSVLWGLISLSLMQQGMKRKDRTIRIISLSLFFITILKLFLSDIRGISEGGKIAAFISLGVLLLVVSFMYQRLKRLILENESIPGNSEEENIPEK